MSFGKLRSVRSRIHSIWKSESLLFTKMAEIPNKRKRYNPLGDSQKVILVKYFDAGMTGTKESFLPLIEKAAHEASISTEKVKQWIGNERQKRRLRAREDEVSTSQPSSAAMVKVPSFLKGATSYNRFSSDIFKTDECKNLSNISERNRFVSEKWRCLTEEEKASYKKDSSVKQIDLNKITEQEKDKLFKTYRKQLESVVGFLEDLGCISSILLLEPDGQLNGLGCSEGQKFFSSNPDVVIKFRQHFSVESDNKLYSYTDVQTLFNDKYSEAVGKPSRVPYLRGGFDVEGLPDGVPFRRPTRYGNKQLKLIMESKDAIKFVIKGHNLTDELQYNNNNDEVCLQPQENDKESSKALFQVLCKVVDQEVAKKAIEQNVLISEDKVEIENLSLSQEECLLILGKARPFFDIDAWVSLGATIKHKMASNHDNGVIVPVFNEADEPYWLFYVTGKVSSLCKVSPNKSIHGYWLDKTPKGYILLNNLTAIRGKNIIKSENGVPLYLQTWLNVERSDTLFEMLPLFHDTILSVVNRLGINH